MSDIAETRRSVRELITDLNELDRTFQKSSAALYGILGLAKRLNLPEPIDQQISMLQRMIATVNMLRTSLTLLEAASGPWGWVMAGISLVGTGLTVAELMEIQRPQY